MTEREEEDHPAPAPVARDIYLLAVPSFSPKFSEVPFT